MKDADLFIRQELGARLAPAEPIEQTGYFEVAAPGESERCSHAYWCALTDRRLWMIASRVGAFGAVQENLGVRVIERAAMAGVHEDRGSIVIGLAGGETLTLVGKRVLLHAENPRALTKALAASFRPYAEVPAPRKPEGRWRTLGVAAAVAVALFVAYSNVYGDEAEVSIRCGGAPQGVRCDLKHESGGASAQACWAVELLCGDGIRARAVADCVRVRPGESRDVVVPAERFHNLEHCDAGTEFKISNFHLKE